MLANGCDKLHDARAIVTGMRRTDVGLKVFDRFTSKRAGTLWYCREIAEVLTARGVPVARELQSPVETMLMER